jgi:hypothetical protein
MKDQLMKEVEQKMKREDLPDSLYKRVTQRDVVELLKPLLKGGWKLRPGDGKFQCNDFGFVFDTPWHYVKIDHFAECHTWFQIVFQVAQQNMKDAFVPSYCQSCWKVVVRPQTLKGLFALEEIQNRSPYSCKCGIEVRPHVFGLYGGYFYNRSFHDGLDCFQWVRTNVDAHPELGTNIPVILKRGCTEMEFKVGPSAEWKATPRQVALEERIDKLLLHDQVVQQLPPHITEHVHRKWVEFAYQYGDPTYAEYTGGLPLYPQYQTYHHNAYEVPKKVGRKYEWLGEKYYRKDLPVAAMRNLQAEEERCRLEKENAEASGKSTTKKLAASSAGTKRSKKQTSNSRRSTPTSKKRGGKHGRKQGLSVSKK